MDFFYQGLDGAILDALDKRQRILELAAEEGAGMAQQKESLLEEAEAAMELPRLVGDVLVGAWFGAAKDKDKDTLRRERLAVIAPWLAGDEPAVRVAAAGAPVGRRDPRPHAGLSLAAGVPRGLSRSSG
jgi:hypothetical protein